MHHPLNSNLYPADLEEWWQTHAERLYKNRDPKHLSKLLAERAGVLSDAFTVNRATGFEQYYQTPDDWIVYGNYFFPQTYARCRFPLAEIVEHRGWKPPTDRPCKIADLGGGTGAAMIGVVDGLLEQFPQTTFDALLVDNSAPALKLFRALVRDCRKRSLFKAEIHQGDLASPLRWKPGKNARYDIIIASFSLGEAFYGKDGEKTIGWLDGIMNLLEDNGLLLILEPALKETSERLEQLRDLVVDDRRWNILAPCPHHFHCPLLADGKYWCHEVRSWTVPPMLNRINHHLRRSLWELKFSFLALAKQAPQPAPPESNTLRLLTPIVQGHGRLLFSGCNAAGQHAEYDLLKRGVSRDTINRLKTIARGDLATLSELTPLGGKNQFRLCREPYFNSHFTPRQAATEPPHAT